MILRLLLPLLGAAICLAAEPAPPVVIRSEPVSGAEAVDPGLGEIRITFNRPMQDGRWSWTPTPFAAFPGEAGPPRLLADGRTCVLPVRLAPGSTYAVGVNLGDAAGFAATDGPRALPWLLTFRTAASAAPAPDAALPPTREVADDLLARRFAAVRARFNAAMRVALSAEQLDAAWSPVAAAGGTFVALGEPRQRLVNGFRVVTIPCAWERAAIDIEVSWDVKQRIAGLYLRPPATPVTRAE